MSKTNGTKPMPQRQRLAALRKERESGRGRSTEPGSAGPTTDTAVVATTPGTGPKKRSGLLWELATVPKQPARENDRSQLQELLEQLPGSQEDMRARIEQLVTSYEAMKASIDEAAQQQRGVEEELGQAVQQAQEEAVGQAAQPAQGAAEQAQGFAEQATETAKKELNTTKAAKRKAEELGVDLSTVASSGPDGRITLNDVKSAVQR